MSSPTIGIIGGSGHMGRWFNRFFSEAGHKVLVAGRTTPLTFQKLAGTSDVVILSIPLVAAGPVCEQIGPVLTPDQLLMDICSLKETMMATMLAATSAQVVGTHPLFGPTAASMQGQNMILCPGRTDNWLDWLIKEFEKSGANVTLMDPAAHDKHMAVVQGLTHFLTICLGRTLQQLNLSPQEALLYSTPVFRTNLDLLGRLFAQDFGLYHNLINCNHHVQSVLETFSTAMEEGRNRLLSEQAEGGIAFMQSIRDFLGPFCEKGLKESNILLNVLYSKSEEA